MPVTKLARPMKYRVQPTPEMERRIREWLTKPLPLPSSNALQHLTRDLDRIAAGTTLAA